MNLERMLHVHTCSSTDSKSVNTAVQTFMEKTHARSLLNDHIITMLYLQKFVNHTDSSSQEKHCCADFKTRNLKSSYTLSPHYSRMFKFATGHHVAMRGGLFSILHLNVQLAFS